MHLLDPKTGKDIRENIQLPYVSEIIAAFGNKKGFVLFIYTDRRILIVDTKELKIIYFGHIEGSGSIFCAYFYENYITLFSAKNYLAVQFAYFFFNFNNEIAKRTVFI